MFSWMLSPGMWAGLLALTTLQIVLGVDNIVLLTVLVRGLPEKKRESARKLGVFVAMISRLALLGLFAFIDKLQKPFATVDGYPVSGQALLLIAGGLFLIAKATQEMYVDVEGHVAGGHKVKKSKKLSVVLTQVFILDIVFSIDQVITAVGMVKNTMIQVLSIVLSVFAMVFFVGGLSKFLEKHPSMRVLALSFLVLVGISLVADSLGYDIPRPMIYFAMAYALGVEALNIRRRAKIPPKPLPSQSLQPLAQLKEAQHIQKSD